jgi:hypothetical protein
VEKGQETKQSNGIVKFPITIDLTGASGAAETGEEGENGLATRTIWPERLRRSAT